MPRDLVNRMIQGALAGMNGTATMTVLRMLAHRLGLIDQMVPQKVEQWARAGVPMRRPALHRVLDHVLHFGYGGAWGALYAALFGSRRRSHLKPALGFGLVQWAFGMTMLFPSLGIGRAAWRSRPRENAVNVASHVLYAAITAFLVEEFARQPRSDVASKRGHLPAVG